MRTKRENIKLWQKRRTQNEDIKKITQNGDTIGKNKMRTKKGNIIVWQKRREQNGDTIEENKIKAKRG